MGCRGVTLNSHEVCHWLSWEEQVLKKKAKGPHCGDCGKALIGLPRLRPVEYMRCDQCQPCFVSFGLVYVYNYVHIYIYRYIDIDIHTYNYNQLYTHVYMYVYIYIYINIYSWSLQWPFVYGSVRFHRFPVQFRHCQFSSIRFASRWR